MAFGRFDESYQPVYAGMEQANERRRKEETHQLTQAAAAAKLRLDLQALEENSMKLEVQRAGQEALLNQAVINKEISKKQLANVDKITSTQLAAMDKTLLDATSGLQTAQTEQMARSFSSVIKEKDPVKKSELYRTSLEQLSSLPGMKEQMSSLGLTGDVYKDNNKLRYIESFAKETLAQQRQKDIMQVESDLTLDQVYAKGGIETAQQREAQAWKSAEAEKDRANQLEIAKLTVAGRVSAAAKTAIGKDPKWADPTNAEALNTAFTKVADGLVTMGVIDAADVAEKGGLGDKQNMLDTMASDMMAYVNRTSKEWAVSGRIPNPVEILELGRKNVIGKIDLEGNYHSTPSDKLKGDEKLFKDTVLKSILAGKKGPEAKAAFEYKLKTDPDYVVAFLHNQWTSPVARSNNIKPENIGRQGGAR